MRLCDSSCSFASHHLVLQRIKRACYPARLSALPQAPEHPVTQPCITSRGVALNHGAVHRITNDCNASCVSASRHAPLQLITRFNISSFDVPDQHVSLQACTTMCMFAAAFDGLQKLQFSGRSFRQRSTDGGSSLMRIVLENPSICRFFQRQILITH
jgi:hypothetical protein